MRLSGVAIILALAHIPNANAQTTASHDHLSIYGSKETEIASLAENLDNVVKVCSAMAVRGGSADKSIRRPERAATDSGILKFYTDPPATVKQLADPKYGPARLAEWFDPHATIYIVAYDNNPFCRAFVLRSPWTADVRPKLFKLIQSDNFWKASEIDTKVESGKDTLLRSVFLSDPGPTVQPMISITAPEGAVPDSRAQMTIAVALSAIGK